MSISIQDAVTGQQYAFAALVNTLAAVPGFDINMLLTRLNGYAQLLEEKDPRSGVAVALRSFASAIDGEPGTASFPEILH